MPDPATHQYAIALSNFELVNYKGTVEALAPLASQNLLDARSSNLLGVAYSKLGLYQQAGTAFGNEIQKNPTDLAAYLNLVTLCADGGNLEKAAEIASKAVEVFPESPQVFVVRGAASTLLGQLDKAAEDFTTASRLSPRSADPRFFLALTDYKLGKFADAVKVLQSAISSKIVDSDLHYLLAECLLKSDPAQLNTAMAELNSAIELDSQSVSARTLRGKLLLDAGHWKEAAADLEFATHQDPSSRSATYNLARAYQKLGRADEAQRLFQQLRTKSGDTISEFGARRLNQALTLKENQP